MANIEVDRETVKKVAKIARISLNEDETVKFSKDLKTILYAFDVLKKADTKGLEPSFHPIKLKERARNDETEKSISQSEALSNTKNRENGYFKGPRAL